MVKALQTPDIANILGNPPPVTEMSENEKKEFCPKSKDSTDAIMVDIEQQQKIIDKITDKECKSKLSDALETYVASTQAAGISLTGAAGYMDQKAFENHVTNSSASGCLQTLLQNNTAVGITNSLLCNATVSQNKSKIVVGTNNSITIRTVKTAAMEELQDKATQRHHDNVESIVSRPPNKYTAEALKTLNEGWAEELKSFDYGIKNVTIKLDSQTKANIESTSQTEIKNETDAVDDLKKMVTYSTAAEIKEKTGYGAMPGSSSFTDIENKVDDLTQSELVKIVDSINETGYSRSTTGSITLEVAGSITDLNIESHQGDIISLKTTMIMSEAQRIGKRLSNEFIADARSSLSKTSEQKGLEDYQSAIGKSIADAIKAQNEGGLFGGMGLMMLLPIIGLLIGGYIFYKFATGGIIGTGIKIALIIGVIVAIYLAVAYFVGLFPFSSEKSEILRPKKWIRKLTINDINKIIEPIGIEKIKQDVKKNLRDLFIAQLTKTKEDYLNSLPTKSERVSMAVFIEGWNDGLNSFVFMKNYVAMPFDMHKDKVFKGELAKYPQWALDIADREELNWDSRNIKDVAKFVDANIKSVFSQKDNRKRRPKYGRKTNYSGRTNNGGITNNGATSSSFDFIPGISSGKPVLEYMKKTKYNKPYQK